MVLCAGLGTRLRPLTDWVPKPLAPLGDRTVLDALLKPLADFPGQRMLNAHHLADHVHAFAAPRPGLRVSHEDAILGTAGGIRRALETYPLPKDSPQDLMVINGDILAPHFPLRELVEKHRQTKAHATLLVQPVHLTGTFEDTAGSNVGFGDDGTVVRLRRQPGANAAEAQESHRGNFLGIYMLDAAWAREALPTSGCIVGDAWIPALIENSARILMLSTDAPFVDVGSPTEYLAANQAWLGEREAWVHPSAVVEAPVKKSIVCANAKVFAPIKNCVVMAGAVVGEPAENQIITPSDAR
jgi:mannose-1-phosphate guanylyltransferase